MINLKKHLFAVSLLLSVFLLPLGLFAGEDDTGKEDIYERVKTMEDEITSLKQALADQQNKKGDVFVKDNDVDEEREKKIDELLEKYDAVQNSDDSGSESFYFAKKTQELEDKGLAAWFGGTDTKPFLKRFGRNTYMGGYMDFEFRATEASEDSLAEAPNPPASNRNEFDTFRQFRFIPFIYSDVSDRVKLSAELEFEFEGVGGGRAGEVIVEFANIDFLINEWINWRGGIILAPLGKLNLVHDTPLQDLVDRPLVSQMIIPTTLSETGMGLFGAFYPSSLSKLDYEVYVVNGFEGLDEDGKRNFSRSSGLAGSNGGFRENANNSFDVVGRLAYSPFLGLELGTSAHTGKYDENNDNRLTIAAIDWAYQKGPFELVGELARDYIERDEFAKVAGITEDMWGYYAEIRYHFMPSILKWWAPTFFTEESTFTAVLRHDHAETVSTDRELDAEDIEQVINTNPELSYLRDRVTVGLNYRFTEDTVFKLDYQINTEHKDLPSISNNALLFQVATYF